MRCGDCEAFGRTGEGVHAPGCHEIPLPLDDGRVLEQRLADLEALALDDALGAIDLPQDHGIGHGIGLG